MDILLMNLQDLERVYRDEPLPREAIGLLDGGMSEVRLRFLLRSHKSVGVYSPKEIRLRDSFDELLSYYSLVEIASIACFVPHPLPREFREEARRHLERPRLRRYYERNYPLLLPTSLRLRMAEAHDLRVESSPLTIGLFMQFLEVSRAITDSSSSMDTFLWYLDGGRWDRYGLDDLLNLLDEPEKLKRHLQRQPNNRLDHSLHGLLEFLAFCGELDGLLQQASDYPLLQSAMWHYHCYWFEHLKGEIRSLVDETITRIGTWSPELVVQASSADSGASLTFGEGGPKLDVQEVRNVEEQQSPELQAVVDRLLDQRMGRPLREALAPYWPPPRHKR